jgi:hypothetical protein
MRALSEIALFALVMVFVFGTPTSPAIAAPAGDDERRAAEASFRREHPNGKFLRSRGQIRRVYGANFGGGATSSEAAQGFVNGHAHMFGVDAADLVPSNRMGGDAVQPLMYDRVTGEYKFHLVHYSQHKDGIPVFRGDLRVLCRNEPGSPVVHASSALRDLKGFSVGAQMQSNAGRSFYVGLKFAAARKAARAAVPGLVNFTRPQVVVWAGVDDMDVLATVALKFVGDDAGPVYQEDQLLEVDVTGNVGGRATQGSGAEQCGAVTSTNMPYARANIGGSVAFANVNGDFSISNGGSGAVTVDSGVRGQYFRVFHQPTGLTTVLSQDVTPPGPANFLHNSSNTEFRRGEVNAYIHANVVRDFVLDINPAYPTIGGQTEFSMTVNEGFSGFCPGNAQYQGSNLRFCAAGSVYPNTAWSSVVYHEYGHHLVSAAGSGQGQYGEGMADTVSNLIFDESGTGFGFFGNCNQPLREADNTKQYPCSGGVHECGRLISACVWHTRNALQSSNPSSYRSILDHLTINSILLHTGSSITPAITTDFLVLDDNDGDLSNGTPHETEILDGFGQHNMLPVPPPANDSCVDAIAICPGTSRSGNTISASSDGSSSCGSSSSSPDAWYHYTPNSNGTGTFSLCNAGSNYDTVLSVHTGCPGSSSNELDCDDDFCGVGGSSQVSISVTAGVTYWVRVTGWNGSAGDFELTVSGPSCASGCSSDGDCDDGNFCNGSETCSGNVCQPDTPPNCSDGNACTIDSCSNNACQNEEIDCDDGNVCTQDFCSAGECVNNPFTPCCGNSTCEETEDCNNCSSDCIGGGGCGDGVCSAGENCLNCSADCRGKQNGNRRNRFCCNGFAGGNAGSNPVDCSDPRCTESGWACGDFFCCGDGSCESAEDESNCGVDCAILCTGSGDCNDGDVCTTDSCVSGMCLNSPVACGPADTCCGPGCNAGNDPDCQACMAGGTACTLNGDCCSNKCRRGLCRGN